MSRMQVHQWTEGKGDHPSRPRSDHWFGDGPGLGGAARVFPGLSPEKTNWSSSRGSVIKVWSAGFPLPESRCSTCSHVFPRASLVAQLVKNLPAMWETWVRSLGWEDPLEEGKATYSSILA